MCKVVKSLCLLLAIFAIQCLVMMPIFVNATTMNTRSSADTWIARSSPDTNYGSDTNLRVNAYGDTSDRERALVIFDLSSIPSGSLINSAYLSLYYSGWADFDPQGFTFYAYRVTQDWNENEATWNLAKSGSSWTGGTWTTEDGASSTVPSSTGVLMTWDVTEIVKDWVTYGQQNYGFIIPGIEPEDTMGKMTAIFSAKERPQESQRPILEIDWSSAAVGGYVTPIDKLTILAPYLALAGLIIAVSTVYIIKRRKD